MILKMWTDELFQWFYECSSAFSVKFSCLNNVFESSNFLFKIKCNKTTIIIISQLYIIIYTIYKYIFYRQYHLKRVHIFRLATTCIHITNDHLFMLVCVCVCDVYEQLHIRYQPYQWTLTSLSAGTYQFSVRDIQYLEENRIIIFL